MKKIDVLFALICGEVIAWFLYGILENFELKIAHLNVILAIVFPLLALLGLWICSLLGKKFLWIYQTGKFALIGAMATLVDLGSLGWFVSLSGIAVGLYFDLFKGASFILATCAKYLFDKFWVFEKMEKQGMGKEFGQFFAVTLIGLVINIAAAHVVVNVIGPSFGMKPEVWATIGGVVAAVVSSVWNFIGYKFIVFKK